MKMNYVAASAVVLFTFWAGTAAARDLMQQKDYSNDEQTLCQPDVFRLCNDYVPDEDRIVQCMTQQRAQLSPQCRKVFEAGLKKRP